MPVHGYKCLKCSHGYEVFYTTMSAVEREEKDEKCPECSSKKKKRLPAQKTSFILRGKGWAKDNYGK